MRGCSGQDVLPAIPLVECREVLLMGSGACNAWLHCGLVNDLLCLIRFDVVDRCMDTLQRGINPVEPAENLVIALELSPDGVRCNRDDGQRVVDVVLQESGNFIEQLQMNALSLEFGLHFLPVLLFVALLFSVFLQLDVHGRDDPHEDQGVKLEQIIQKALLRVTVFYKIEGGEKIVPVDDNRRNEDDILFQELLRATPELFHVREFLHNTCLNPNSPAVRYGQKIERKGRMINQNLVNQSVEVTETT
jgi:hypothetical protein